MVILRSRDDEDDYTPLLTVNLSNQLITFARDGGTLPYIDIDIPNAATTLRYGLVLRDSDDETAPGCSITASGTSVTWADSPVQDAITLQVEVIGRAVKISARADTPLRLYRRDVRAKQAPIVITTDWNAAEPFIDVTTTPGHVYANSVAQEAPLDIAPKQDNVAVHVSLRGPEAYAVVRPMDRLIRLDSP